MKKIPIIVGIIIRSALWNQPPAHADGDQGGVINVGANDLEVIAECNRKFFPPYEVRFLSDLPLTLMVTWKDGQRSVSPAGGLDVAGFWITPIRPHCVLRGGGEARAPLDGVSLSFVASANVSLLALDSPQNLTVLGPDGNAQMTTINGKNLGFFGGGLVGAYVNWRFDAGGHQNRIALAFLVGLGGFAGISGTKDSGEIKTIALGLVLSR